MKDKIENIKVSCGSVRPCVSWTIGTDRYHVWLGDRQSRDWQETVFKNPVASHGQPGHYETRQLDRINSKRTAAMFADVMTVVKRDDLLAKAQIAEGKRIANIKIKLDLEGERCELEEQVLAFWRQGEFDKAAALHPRYLYIVRQLSDLTEAATS